MAYQIQKINPLDLKNSVAIGIAIPFNGNAIFNLNYTTKDQIRSNLINFFLTNKRERVFQPLFGADLKRKIFENITNNTISDIEGMIESILKTYFPQIILNNLEIIQLSDQNEINIQFDYSVKDTTITDTISLNF
jgi:phage baseplate assembly protein W